MLVHNISDRVSTHTPKAYQVGQQLIRPGKNAEVRPEDISKKDRALHGGPLWFGTLPPHLYPRRSAAVAAAKEAMTADEVSEYLTSRSVEELLTLCSAVVPPLLFAHTLPASVLAVRVARVIASGRVLDPEAFFWLRRWSYVDGQYLEK